MHSSNNKGELLISATLCVYAAVVKYNASIYTSHLRVRNKIKYFQMDAAAAAV